MIKIIPGRNVKEFYMDISRLEDKTKRGIRRAFYRFGKRLVSNTKNEILRGRKSGIVYRIRRGSRTLNHTASADGETPASISGDLWRSLDFKVNGSYSMKFGYDNTVDYGNFLENGTRKMKKKPGLLNSINKLRGTGNMYFNDELKRTLRKR